MWKIPPCSGAGRSARPSGCSVDVGAEAAELGGQRGQPVGLVAADVGDAAQVATGRRPARTARRPPGSARRRRAGRRRCRAAGRGPRTFRPSSSSVTVQPIAWRISRSASPAWVVAAGQSRTTTRPPVTAASARNGAAFDRSGSMRWSTGGDGPGATRPPVRLGVVDLDAVLAQHRDGHVDVGQRGHRLAVVPDVDPVRRSARRPAAARRRTARTRTRRSRRVPPRTEPVPSDLERQGARPSSTTSMPRLRRAASTSPIGRVRMCGSPSKATGAGREPGDRRHEPHHGAGQSAVDVRRRGRTVQGSPVQSGRRGVDERRRGRQGARPSAGCRATAGRGVRRRGRRRARRAAAPGWSATCCPGSRDVGVDRPRRPRCCPVLAQLR